MIPVALVDEFYVLQNEDEEYFSCEGWTYHLDDADRVTEPGVFVVDEGMRVLRVTIAEVTQ